MRKIITLLILFLGFQSILEAQESDHLHTLQNPNFEVSLKDYQAINKNLILLQGTTLQETYKAIDPQEQKRERRAERRLRRHERALARANRPTYLYGYDYYDPYPGFCNYNNFGYNYNQVSIPVAIGAGLIDFAIWSSCFW